MNSDVVVLDDDESILRYDRPTLWRLSHVLQTDQLDDQVNLLYVVIMMQ